MRHLACVVLALAAQPLMANDWEKFFVAVPQEGAIDATIPPEVLPSLGDVDKDIEAMFRRGFVPVGYTSFNSANDKTNDGVKLAKKIGTRYLVVSTQLVSTQTSTLPLTLPNTTTTTTNGSASVSGTGGSVQGTYSGTSKTYGTRITYIPYSVNRFDKLAIYFKEIPRKGAGLKVRDLANEEMVAIGTRHAFAVLFVMDGSPAFDADIFPGDFVTQVNGDRATADNWRQAINGLQPMKVRLIRNGSPIDIAMNIPESWQGLP